MKGINVFYHIYSIDGVDSIIDEQIDKLIKHKKTHRSEFLKYLFEIIYLII